MARTWVDHVERKGALAEPVAHSGPRIRPPLKSLSAHDESVLIHEIGASVVTTEFIATSSNILRCVGPAR